jgi:hypothetical protein
MPDEINHTCRGGKGLGIPTGSDLDHLGCPAFDALSPHDCNVLSFEAEAVACAAREQADIWRATGNSALASAIVVMIEFSEKLAVRAARYRRASKEGMLKTRIPVRSWSGRT